jgi:hypothetical protein
MVTLSDYAWIDAIQNDAYLKPKGFSGVTGCDAAERASGSTSRLARSRSSSAASRRHDQRRVDARHAPKFNRRSPLPAARG